jgi:glycosyltransferase involved in cell wall biosynthesis
MTDLSIVAIIPLYNGAKWIEQSMRSVLCQTLQPDEFVVVDDGSTDGGAGAAIVERMAQERPIIKLLRKPNGGQSSARNFAVRHSSSALIALLDQDDIWYPTHLEELLEPFKDPKNPRLGWVYSDFDEVDKDGLMMTHRMVGKLAEHPKRNILRCLSENMLITPGCSLIRRAAFESIGGFDERLSGYEDDDLFLRLFRAGYDNIFIERSLSQWRIFEGSSGHSHRMYVSAMIYMNKLVEAFPDDKFSGHHYARDLIAPRFLMTFMMIYGRSVRNRNSDQCREAVEHMKQVLPLLRWRAQIPLRLILPLMGSPVMGSALFAARPLLQRVYRAVFA